MSARARSICVALILAGGAFGLVASTQTWVDVRLRTGAGDVVSAGTAALPLLAPLSLAALALGLALAIVGRVLRLTFGIVAIAIGVPVAFGAGQVFASMPLEAYAAAVTAGTGIRGDDAVAGLVAAASVTAWPIAAAVGGALIALGGALTVATGLRWRGSDRRYHTDTDTPRTATYRTDTDTPRTATYRTDTTTPRPDAVPPTRTAPARISPKHPARTPPGDAPHHRTRRPTAEAGRTDTAATSPAPRDAVDSWDELSRGEDPTAR